MKGKDRFKEFDDEVRQLVLEFERTVMRGESQFFDVDELEVIIDYYLEVGDNEPLVNAIVYAEQLYPESSEIKIRRAHWYIANHKLDRALDILLRLEEADGDNTDVAYSLGVLYSEMGNHERAIDYYLHAATDGWQVGRIYSNIAEEYYKMNRYVDAIEYYMKAFDTGEYDTDMLYNYLDTCEQADLVEHAVDYLYDLAHKQPYCREAWYCLGCAYGDMGLYEKAIDALEYAITVDKDYAMAYFELAHVHEQNGNVGEAATVLIHLLDIDSDRAVVYRSLGHLFLRHDNDAAAISYFKKAIDSNPEDADSLASLGLCLLHQFELSTAQSLCERALAIDAENPDGLCCLALVSDCYGDKEKALELFDQVMDGNRYEEYHCRYYTLFLYGSGYYDILIGFAEDSLQLYPHDKFYSTYLAACFYHTNRYNSLRRIMPDVDAETLHHICPEMWDNPVMAPIIPEIK